MPVLHRSIICVDRTPLHPLLYFYPYLTALSHGIDSPIGEIAANHLTRCVYRQTTGRDASFDNKEVLTIGCSQARGFCHYPDHGRKIRGPWPPYPSTTAACFRKLHRRGRSPRPSVRTCRASPCRKKESSVLASSRHAWDMTFTLRTGASKGCITHEPFFWTHDLGALAFPGRQPNPHQAASGMLNFSNRSRWKSADPNWPSIIVARLK